MSKKIVFLVIIVLFITNQLLAIVPCDTIGAGSNYRISINDFTNEIHLSSDMPLNVMIGYLVLDSVSKNAKLNQISEFLNRQTYNDTLKYLAKYLYSMLDYDPIRFFHYMHYSNPNRWDILPGFIHEDFISLYYDNNTDFANNYILQSYYILHVSVVDTVRIPNIDTNEVLRQLCKFTTEASLFVIDTIKGRVFPSKYSPLFTGNNFTALVKDFNNKKKVNSVGLQNYFTIWYCNQWPIGQSGSRRELRDENDITFLKPGKEYIMFIIPRITCFESPNNAIYYLPAPFSFNSTSAGMYEIENGNVLDPGNDFGLGTQIPINNFKIHLNAIINSIKNFGE